MKNQTFTVKDTTFGSTLKVKVSTEGGIDFGHSKSLSPMSVVRNYQLFKETKEHGKILCFSLNGQFTLDKNEWEELKKKIDSYF
jgi:hypothetical protein